MMLVLLLVVLGLLFWKPLFHLALFALFMGAILMLIGFLSIAFGF